jgi:hypothetical protein
MGASIWEVDTCCILGGESRFFIDDRIRMTPLPLSAQERQEVRRLSAEVPRFD